MTPIASPRTLLRSAPRCPVAQARDLGASRSRENAARSHVSSRAVWPRDSAVGDMRAQDQGDKHSSFP